MSKTTYETKTPTIDNFCDPEPQEEKFHGFPCFLFTQKELFESGSRDKMLCRCAHCGKTFWKEKHFLQRNVHNNQPLVYCSYECSMKHRTVLAEQKHPHPDEYVCETCGKIVLWEERYASGRFCCSQCYHKFSSKVANSSEARKKKSNTLKSFYKQRNLPKNNLKLIYKNQCKFRMNVNVYILLSTFTDTDLSNWYGINHIYNREQTSRDHMVSQEYGYNHKIDPYLISHPANCLLIKQGENSSKKEGCSLTLRELIERVEFFNECILEQKVDPNATVHQYKLNPNLSKEKLKHYFVLSMCD